MFPKVTRRRFLKQSGLTLAAAGGAPLISAPFASPAWAQAKTLTIVQWSHFVPAYDKWFDQFAKDWGEKNKVSVTVDHIPVANVAARAAAEASAGSGHDLFGWNGAGGAHLYRKFLVDLTSLVQSVEQKHGKANQGPFVGGKCIEPTHPGAGNTNTQQHEGQQAARRTDTEGGEDPSGCSPFDEAARASCLPGTITLPPGHRGRRAQLGIENGPCSIRAGHAQPERPRPWIECQLKGQKRTALALVCDEASDGIESISLKPDGIAIGKLHPLHGPH